MSWKIETIIANRLKLKEEHDLESDDYNDLLIIESKAKELYNLGILSRMEGIILNDISNGESLKDISKKISLVERTILMIFKRACEKIAFCLGGEFTDFGTIDELVERFDFTNEQLENLTKYMKSKYKHNLSNNKSK